MGVPCVWNDANNKDLVAQAQQEPSHSCVCCCPSVGPGMGPREALRGSPRSTCIRRSAAPAAASPLNTRRCAFTPLVQPLERRWGKPSLSTPTPAARMEPSSAMSVTAGSPRRPHSRDTLCKSTATNPTSATAARPPSATRGTSPATKPSIQEKSRTAATSVGRSSTDQPT